MTADDSNLSAKEEAEIEIEIDKQIKLS